MFLYEGREDGPIDKEGLADTYIKHVLGWSWKKIKKKRVRVNGELGGGVGRERKGRGYG